MRDGAREKDLEDLGVRNPTVEHIGDGRLQVTLRADHFDHLLNTYDNACGIILDQLAVTEPTDRTRYGEDPDDAWDSFAPADTFLGKCEQCFEIRPCRIAIDPYLSEVYRQMTYPEPWCGTCFHRRKDQI